MEEEGGGRREEGGGRRVVSRQLASHDMENMVGQALPTGEYPAAPAEVNEGGLNPSPTPPPGLGPLADCVMTHHVLEPFDGIKVAESYLLHIVTRYHDLHRVTLFLKGGHAMAPAQVLGASAAVRLRDGSRRVIGCR